MNTEAPFIVEMQKAVLAVEPVFIIGGMRPKTAREIRRAKNKRLQRKQLRKQTRNL